MTVKTFPMTPRIHLHQVVPAVELIFDENATETTVEFVNTNSDAYDMNYDENRLYITWSAEDETGTDPFIVRLMEGPNAPVLDLSEGIASKRIIITTGVTQFYIAECANVVGAIGGDLETVVVGRDQMNITSGGDIIVRAADIADVALIAKGDIYVYAQADATVKTTSHSNGTSAVR